MLASSPSPRRPLLLPESVEAIRTAARAATELLVVGGTVRDALLGRPIQDIDLVTPGDGLKIARALADALHGAYYPLDSERHTGRIRWLTNGETLTIDVASFRGASLEEDLRARDFTINAMASPLTEPSTVIDPLGGQRDLFDQKVLRQCNPHSIPDDPIRALRAVRMSLQFRLRMTSETREAVRNAASLLYDQFGDLLQPERCRDELFKLLAGPHTASAVRLLQALGLLDAIAPYPLSASQFTAIQLIVDRVSQLVSIIEPRNDNTASDLTLGVAVMILDRHRQHLQKHLGKQVTEDRTRRTLLLLASVISKGTDAGLWATRLRLSNREHKTLKEILIGGDITLEPDRINNRQIFKFYRKAGESGIEGLLMALARYLAEAGPGLDAIEWGQVLEQVASPILDAFFQRYGEVVSPSPLVTGDDLQYDLGVQPGPLLGRILFQLLEEQAAGTISTKQEALQLAANLLDESGYGPTSTTNGS